MKLFGYCLMLIILIEFGNTVKILGVFPSPGYSQFILGEKLMSELARRGHEVTVISAFQPKVPLKNYRTILAKAHRNAQANFQLSSIDIFSTYINFYQFTYENSEIILAEDAVQKLIHSNETFDVVIIETFGNEAHMGFASHFKAPLISFSSLGLCEWTADLVGNIRLPSVIPLLMTHFTNHMSFWERTENTVVYIFESFYKYFIVYPQQQLLLNRYFPGTLDLKQAMNSVDLLLMNSDVTTTNPTLLTSAVVEIGGFHISTKPLSTDLQTFLDGAKDGAILFSMGSNLKSKDFSKEQVDGMLKIFSKLKQRILWKFEDLNIANKPDNVYISKWLPQSDILAHPNVIAFITHAGLLGTTEAIYYGVPMITIPIFGDQKMNSRRIVENKLGIELLFENLTQENLSRCLKEILKNPEYTKNVKKYSNILKHKPVQPIDLAMYWIEHIVHYKGGSHLRNASMDLNWFQFYLLDVVSFFVVISVTLMYLLYILIRMLRSIITSRFRNSKKKKV